MAGYKSKIELNFPDAYSNKLLINPFESVAAATDNRGANLISESIDWSMALMRSFQSLTHASTTQPTLTYDHTARTLVVSSANLELDMVWFDPSDHQATSTKIVLPIGTYNLGSTNTTWWIKVTPGSTATVTAGTANITTTPNDAILIGATTTQALEASLDALADPNNPSTYTSTQATSLYIPFLRISAYTLSIFGDKWRIRDQTSLKLLDRDTQYVQVSDTTISITATGGAMSLFSTGSMTLSSTTSMELTTTAVANATIKLITQGAYADIAPITLQSAHSVWVIRDPLSTFLPGTKSSLAVMDKGSNANSDGTLVTYYNEEEADTAGSRVIENTWYTLDSGGASRISFAQRAEHLGTATDGKTKFTMKVGETGANPQLLLQVNAEDEAYLGGRPIVIDTHAPMDVLTAPAGVTSKFTKPDFTVRGLGTSAVDGVFAAIDNFDLNIGLARRKSGIALRGNDSSTLYTQVALWGEHNSASSDRITVGKLSVYDHATSADVEVMSFTSSAVTVQKTLNATAAGGIAASVGDIVATAGNITADVNITATTGNVVSTAGNVVATAGEVLDDRGSVTSRCCIAWARVLCTVGSPTTYTFVSKFGFGAAITNSFTGVVELSLDPPLPAGLAGEAAIVACLKGATTGFCQAEQTGTATVDIVIKDSAGSPDDRSFSVALFALWPTP
jgi:hypothetical protein